MAFKHINPVIMKLFTLSSIFRLTIFNVVILSSVFAGEWVKYGWQLYDQPGDARILSLGGAQVAQGQSISSVLVNPANDAFAVRDDFSYAHQSRFGGTVQHDLLAFSVNRGFARPINIVILQEYVGGIPNTIDGLMDWGADGIPGTQDAGEGNGVLDEGERLDADKITNFHQQQWGLYVSTTWKMNDWTVGAGVKGLFHSIDTHYANGIGFNVGARRNLWKTISVGAAVSDVTTSWLVWDNGTTERALPVLMAGLAGDFTVPLMKWPSSFFTDIVFDLNGEFVGDQFSSGSYRVGLELAPKPSVRIRTGLSETSELTGGLGIVKENWIIDYTYKPSPSGSSLGSSHILTFTVSPRWIFGLLGVSY